MDDAPVERPGFRCRREGDGWVSVPTGLWLQRLTSLGVAVVLGAQVVHRDAAHADWYINLATLFCVLSLVNFLYLLRLRAVADGHGVAHLPIGAKAAWSEVDHVAEPGPRDREATLVLRNGRRMRSGFPAAGAADLAALGHVPLGAPA